MSHLNTKTFKLRAPMIGEHGLPQGGFDYFCSYCGKKADYTIESDDRDATYHYFCNCPTANREKVIIREMQHLRNEISKRQAAIAGIKPNNEMVRAKEYESKLKALNNEYFPGGGTSA